jgi:hypothetical protein
VDDAARSFGGRVERTVRSRQAPAEPPTDIFDTFESERYISKLIQWSLEASKRERSRPQPYLVERDDDPER